MRMREWDFPLPERRVEKKEEVAWEKLCSASGPLLRVWRMENGIPVALGTVPASVREPQLLHLFPELRKGDAIRCRAICPDGKETGMEFTHVVGSTPPQR